MDHTAKVAETNILVPKCPWSQEDEGASQDLEPWELLVHTRIRGLLGVPEMENDLGWGGVAVGTTDPPKW